MLCYFLIGPPGAGKSTFAQTLQQLTGAQIVSTDTIRAQLYGDETEQGDWTTIEAKALEAIATALAQTVPVIYDATNARRVWRLTILQKLHALAPDIQWLAWHLQTPLATCKRWNRQRARRVPETVVEELYQALKHFPPLPAEGFVAVEAVRPHKTIQSADIERAIARLPRRTINRANRTQHPTMQFHAYSRLLDFERLMHLIALLLRYPGLGSLHTNNPALLSEIVREIPEAGYRRAVDEIAAVIARKCGAIYADAEALARDLHWLSANDLVHRGTLQPDLDQQPFHIELLNAPDSDTSDLVAHAYSDLDAFKRLLTAIRLILHHPFLTKTEGGHLDTLAAALADCEGMGGSYRDRLRKDIENVLRPYGILPPFPLKHGYFAGTGILTVPELKQVLRALQTHANSIDDPIALAAYSKLSGRMMLSKVEQDEIYPVRAIANRSMIDTDLLHPSSLPCQSERLETAIEQGEMLELGRLASSANFKGDQAKLLIVWPLQIVFYNFAWYLGFEQAVGSEAGLVRFERLDRLFLSAHLGKQRTPLAQRRSLARLHKLLAASAGLFLGYSASDQKQFLQARSSERRHAEIVVELWCSDYSFRFISEGTKRFPLSQLKMSSPPGGRTSSGHKSLFSLPPTEDSRFPHRLCVNLPRWSLQDVDLLRWIIGFGGEVKVVQPQNLRERIQQLGQAIVGAYQ